MLAAKRTKATCVDLTVEDLASQNSTEEETTTRITFLPTTEQGTKDDGEVNKTADKLLRSSTSVDPLADPVPV